MFSWDARKALRNLAKHGVPFEAAATAFADPEALDWSDFEHSGEEQRFKRLGTSISGRVLLIVYTVRRIQDERETIRIISARQASRKERQAYSRRAD